MKILVTGANGYLGQGIVKKLIDEGNEIIATDFEIDNIDYRAKKIRGDLFEIENPFFLFGKPEVIIHLAWRDGFKHYSNIHLEDLNKHYKFLKTIAESGIKKIVVMGSMHEVGFCEGSINEDTPCFPITPYGISKNALRQLTQMLAKQNEITYQWLRGFYIVSNSKFGSSIFSKIALAAENGITEFPFTMGQNQFDFIDYDEFVKQVIDAVRQDTINGVINICSGKPEKLSDRVERFIKENNYCIKLKYGTYPDRPYDSKAVWGDDSKMMIIRGSEGI